MSSEYIKIKNEYYEQSLINSPSKKEKVKYKLYKN